MVLMEWRLSRSLILYSMIIFLNLGSKYAAIGFPTGCTSSPIGSPVLLHEHAESLGSHLEGGMELGKGE